MLGQVNAGSQLLSQIPDEYRSENFPIRRHRRARSAHRLETVKPKLALERTVHIGMEKHQRLLEVQIAGRSADLIWVFVRQDGSRYSCDLLEAFGRGQW